MKFDLTRIAPTPSGFLHLGNAYSFLITKAIAEKTGAKILLRIDDLDRDRFRMEYLLDIFETLDFLEIKYDIGPKNPEDFLVNWTQLNRSDLYKEAMEKLWSKKLLFACTCSRKKIAQMNSSGYYLGHCLDRNISKNKMEAAWRMDTLESDLISIRDLDGHQTEHVLLEEAAFFIVRKKDGLPSYQLSSVVDDLHYGVDLIIRGQDLFNSSLSQLLLAKGLDEEKFIHSTFHHHALLKNLDGTKLSKTAGDTSIQFLRNKGLKKADIIDLIRDMTPKLKLNEKMNFDIF